MYTTRLEEIKRIHDKAKKAWLRLKETGCRSNSIIVTDNLLELFSNGHTDWLIEQTEMIEELKSKLSDLVSSIYEHANAGTELMELAEGIDESH